MNKREVEKKVLDFERWVKVLIFLFAMKMISKDLLWQKIRRKIDTIDLPKDLHDRDVYYRGFIQSSKNLINKIYVPIVNEFNLVKGDKAITDAGRNVVINKPKDLWAVQKGSPNVYDYKNTLKKALKGLDKDSMVTSEIGKRPITMWQKVELDVRHNAQMERVQQAYESGQDLFWLSSHPNCSKRCEKWQGKLVSLHKPAIDNTFWTGETINGVRIYSFKAIENQVDKYGYKNNIIIGFNCRHKLLAYGNERRVPPEKFSEGDIAKKRKQEQYLRLLERKIRKNKTKYLALKDIDKPLAKVYNEKRKELFKKYQTLCKEWGFAIEDYRL